MISVFGLFTVGLGPSSSHTVGPMRAAQRFVRQLLAEGTLADVDDLRVDVYGSLAATGHGHGTFPAILLGLEGHHPERILPAEAEASMARIEASGQLLLGRTLSADAPEITIRLSDIVTHPLTILPRHPNGLRLSARGLAGAVLADETYFSVGGGFVVSERDENESVASDDAGAVPEQSVPFPFETASELLGQCAKTGSSIPEIMWANERVSRTEAELRTGLRHIWEVMEACKDSALTRDGELPGGLHVRRRAPEWHRTLSDRDPNRAPEHWQEWVNLVALAVNEENASGGRVVTAPTNGAAGIIPAVLFYATHYAPGAREWSPETRDRVISDFLLTAGAIGVLVKSRASISGAEVGCQGEVGSASSMAAAGLAQTLGGTPAQVENAAEIAMEHNLGLTCDPIGGLVQIPCIERNAIAASKAINAARMALMGDGSHHVSLDQVIATMRETGRDMSSKYKETAQGGLAVNVVEC